MAVHLREEVVKTVTGATGFHVVATCPDGEHWRVRSCIALRSGAGTALAQWAILRGADIGVLALDAALGNLEFLTYGEPAGGQQAMEAGDELAVFLVSPDTFFCAAAITAYTDS